MNVRVGEATLFAEKTRSPGFGVRDDSVELHDPSRTLSGSADGGSTYAENEVDRHCAGWIIVDPRRRSAGGANPIPIAVAYDIRQAMPAMGRFVGPFDAVPETSLAVGVSTRDDPDRASLPAVRLLFPGRGGAGPAGFGRRDRVSGTWISS